MVFDEFSSMLPFSVSSGKSGFDTLSSLFLLMDDDSFDMYEHSINQIASKFPDLIKLLRDLSAFRNYTFDIDESNVMMRGVMPVLTDPFA